MYAIRSYYGLAPPDEIQDELVLPQPGRTQHVPGDDVLGRYGRQRQPPAQQPPGQGGRKRHRAKTQTFRGKAIALGSYNFV